MSLVNDLLIEIDRQREETDPSQRHRLDGIRPRRSRPNRRIGAAPFALFTSGLMLFVGAAALNFSAWEIPAIGTKTPEARPAVSARRTDPLHAVRPDPMRPSQATQRIDSTLDVAAARSTPDVPPTESPTHGLDQITVRPVAIQSISISHDAHTSRLRITAEESAAYRIEESESPLEFEIILEAASLESPITDLELLGTPIRSIRVHSEDEDLRLALALDERVRIQSQWIRQNYGAVLVIDLQGSSRAEAQVGQPTSSAVLLRSPTDSSDLPTRGSTQSSVPEESDIDFIDGPERTQPLGIARSEGDRRRGAQRDLRTRARRILEAARIARTQGNLQEANALYESAIDTMPDFREAILEWAALLADSNQVPDAVALVREARTKSPKDSGLTMLHATIIAQVGDLKSAIRILDQSDHNLTQAPDLHALAAAFLQQEGKHGLAIERYERILRRYPSEARWWMGLGISLEATERRAEALDVYRIAVQLGELPSKARQWVSSRVTVLGEEV